MTHWASAIGRMVLHQLSDLYRALVWEGFILLAVAAGEDSASVKPAVAADVAPPSPPVVAMEVGGVATEVGGVATLGGQMVPDVVVQAASLEMGVAMDTRIEGDMPPASEPESVQSPEDTPAAPPPALPPAPPPSTTPVPPPTTATSSEEVSQHPSILVESLKQLTPLLTITSRVGRSLAELMSLLIRLSTSPLHRTHRRGVGHPLIVHSYQEPAKEAIEVCMEVSNLLLDSLKWEVPMPQACSSAMQSPIRDWLFAG